MTTSVGKYTDSVKRPSNTPAKVKIQRFHNNLKKGGLFEQQVPLQDKAHFFNPHYVSEHAATIYDHCLEEESKTLPNPRYMTYQRDINTSMREILMDWLIQVHIKYKLRTETLFLTVNLIDRYLGKVVIMRKNLQLVGVAAMLIASKYEEIYPPTADDFVYITDYAY